MSAIPQYYCCTEHRDERFSTINLIGFLANAYQQVLTLFKTQTQLMKQCKRDRERNSTALAKGQDHNIDDLELISQKVEDLIVQLIKTTNNATEGIALPMVNLPSKIIEDIPNAESDIDTSVDNSACDMFTEAKLSKSPVLHKSKAKFKRKSIPVNISNISQDYAKVLGSRTEFSKNDHKLFSRVIQDKHSCNESELSDDVIPGTPAPTTYKKIGFSKLYNAGSSISTTGKIIRQTTLVLTPARKDTDVSKPQWLSPLKPLQNDTPKRQTAVIVRDKSEIEYKNDISEVDTDIIDESPQYKQSHSKLKSKLSIKQNYLEDNFNKSMIYKEATSKGLKDYSMQKENFLPSQTISSQLSQLSPLFSSTQIAKISDSNPEANNMTSSNSHSARNMWKTDENFHSKRKVSSLDDTSESGNDETYFSPVEKRRGKDISLANDNEAHSDIDETAIHEPPPTVKKSLLTSFANLQSKEKSMDIPVNTKNKELRAKFDGIQCWECQQYYKYLGLTDEEIKKRTDTCSRHRHKYGQRDDTPEGFWDCDFPDTQESTLQNG